MDPVRNPYVPGAGTPPPELAGRRDVLERAQITLERVRQKRPSKSFLLVGLRGVGKTVLLNRINEIAESGGYHPVYIEASEDKQLSEILIPALKQLLFTLDRMENLNYQVKRALRVLKSFANSVKITVKELEIGLEIDPEKGTADSGDINADLSELFLAVGSAADARATAVPIIIDELQYLSAAQLGALIGAIHRVVQKQLPLVLIGAGLPQLVGLSGKSKSYAERLVVSHRVV
jgi:Cdc6-like AAA superfamily ATPase